MLVIPLFQDYNAAMSIVILWRRRVMLYKKLCFVHYSTEIKCRELRFSSGYSYSLLIDLAGRTA